MVMLFLLLLRVHRKFTNNFSENFLILISEMCSGISKGAKMVGKLISAKEG